MWRADPARTVQPPRTKHPVLSKTALSGIARANMPRPHGEKNRCFSARTSTVISLAFPACTTTTRDAVRVPEVAWRREEVGHGMP